MSDSSTTWRTPRAIVAHMGDLFDWALTMAQGQTVWREAPLAANPPPADEIEYLHSQRVRALDETEFERKTLADERKAVLQSPEGSLGEALDVSAQPEDLVAELLHRLGMR